MDTSTFRSLQWMHELRDAEIPEALKLLGYVMMARADAQGLMRPTVEQIRLATPKNLEDDDSVPVSRSTIQRRRAKLVKLGWIQLVSKGQGRGRASVYRLAFPTVKRVWGAAENASENASEDFRENASGQTHQERHQEQVQDQVQANGSPRPLTLRSGFADLGADEEDIPW